MGLIRATTDPGVLSVVGAGPAGLSAALAARRTGRAVVVFERKADVGARFHGDFQGLENWSRDGDVLAELGEIGIAPTFEATPCREQVVFGPDGREHTFRDSRPFYYLVRRGSEPGTLDHALKQQALAAGVEIRFGETVRHPGDRDGGGGIVAWGPRRADILGVGYLFTTDLADGCFAVIDNRLAPGGYGYLLVAGGRATLAICIFRDFDRESEYLERTVDFFRRRVGVTLRDPRRFGGVGNVRPPAPLRRDSLGGTIWTGEAGGIQDALWGFGIRYAMLSGRLAVQAAEAAGGPAAAAREPTAGAGRRRSASRCARASSTASSTTAPEPPATAGSSAPSTAPPAPPKPCAASTPPAGGSGRSSRWWRGGSTAAPRNPTPLAHRCRSARGGRRGSLRRWCTGSPARRRRAGSSRCGWRR